MKHIFVWFSIVSLIMIGCEGTRTADEYFNAAEVERNAKNIKVSLENLEKLIEHYPDNALAAQAQYLMGDIYMNDLRDFENAILSYQKVVDNFSGSSKVAHAQFMVGYIYAENLNKKDLARTAFQRFINEHSDDVGEYFLESAKQELRSLEDGAPRLEDILQNN